MIPRRVALAMLPPLLLTGCLAGEAAPGAGADDTPPDAIASAITTRRIWSNASDIVGDLSPDGRQLSFVDWTTGDLALYDVVSEARKPLTGKGSWSVSSDFAIGSSFSPDGRRLAYAWYVDPVGFELRVMDLETRRWRTIHAGEGYIQPYGWTPDGRAILTKLWEAPPNLRVMGAYGRHRLALISTDGTLEYVLDTPLPPLQAALSPDGRSVAYDRSPPDGPTSARDVFVLDLASKRSKPLMQGPSDDRLLGWLGAVDAVLMLSDRSGSPAIWLQPMSGGEPVGDPRLVRNDVGEISPIAVRDDALVYFLMLDHQRVMTADVDLESGRLLGTPTSVSAPGIGASSPAWSPDGRYLAYLVRSALPDRSATLVIRGSDGTQLREMPLPLDDLNYLRWTHDRDAMIAMGTDATGASGVHRIDLVTGRTTLLVPNSGYGLRHPQLSPDDRTLYFLRDDAGRSGVYAVDLASRRERTLYARSPGGMGNIELAPDGSALALTGYVNRDMNFRVLLVPAQGGEPREILAGPAETFSPGYGAMAWSPDGRRILYVERNETNDRSQLWVAALDGSPPRQLLEDASLAWMRLHPNGRRIAFAAGNNTGELWVMEGFERAAAVVATADSERR